jgi:hypothetical protein
VKLHASFSQVSQFRELSQLLVKKTTYMHYRMKGTTSVPMCSIFVHRCVPLVLFSLFWAFDVFPFFLLCNFLFYVVAHAELVDLFSFHVVTPSCHSFYLTIFLLTN